MDDDGYPTYRRRDNEKYYNRPNGYVVNNRFVVPYSPYLLKKFNCHCNVEIVSSIKSVKYLFKYIYKGHDAALLNIQGTATNVNEIIYDEINEHIEARYVGPVEAVWRILGKKLQGRSHSVTRLPVHLPNKQNLTIDPDTDALSLEHIIEQKNMLIDYFLLNKRDKNARKYLYTEIPNHYTFSKTKINNQYTGSWKERRTYFTTIGRMYAVNPSQTELFHLRLLLLTTRGAQSFTDLRKVNKTLEPTFTAACISLGLIADDHEWDRVMKEAEIWMMPYQLRRLFIRILIHCQPLYPENLYNKFKLSMSEDFNNKQNSNITEAEQKLLQQLQYFLEQENKTLKDFPNLPQITQINQQIIDEIYTKKLFQTGLEYYKKLNNDQKQIIEAILKSIENKNNNNYKCFYINGPGGSGKTFLYITLWYLLMGQKINVQSTAYTGIAAILLPQGKTVHKTFGLPVPLFSDSNSNIKLQTMDATKLQEIKVFIWDEAPMAPRYALETIDRLLQEIMNNNKPFGGKTMILGRDFRQLLPVNLDGTRSETINLSIKYSHLWKFFNKYVLLKNMRTLPDEIEFSKILLQIGDGILNDKEDNIQLDSSYIDDNDTCIAKDVFGEILKNKQYKIATKCAILAPKNKNVDQINKEVVELLDINTERVYLSVDTPEKWNETEEINLCIVPENLNSLNPSFLPSKSLGY